MCGRYTQHHSTDQVVLRFDVTRVVCETSPRYNAAPTQMMPVITQSGDARSLDAYRWGLVPFWAKDAGIGSRMINARAETVAEKPAFRSALKKRRCLIPADGYYEWKAESKVKQPIYYKFADDRLFALAGLWEEWRQPDGEPLRSFTIITTAPNNLAGLVHDRMPAIIQPEYEALWMDPRTTEYGDLLPALQPYPDDDLIAQAVSTRVNAPGLDESSLTAPLSG